MSVYCQMQGPLEQVPGRGRGRDRGDVLLPGGGQRGGAQPALLQRRACHIRHHPRHRLHRPRRHHRPPLHVLV